MKSCAKGLWRKRAQPQDTAMPFAADGKGCIVRTCFPGSIERVNWCYEEEKLE